MLERSIKASTRFAARAAKRASPAPEFLIEQQDFRIDCRSDRKSQSHQHAGRIGPHRKRQIVAEFTERLDLRHFSFNLVTAHAEQKPAGHDIFVASIVEIEPGRRVEQWRYVSVDADRRPARLINAGKDAQHRRFAGAVVANDAELIAVIDRERHVIKRAHDNALASTVLLAQSHRQRRAE